MSRNGAQGDAMTDRQAGAGPRWSVVLADDAVDLRRVLRRLLERDGRFEVVGEADDGAAAVALVVERRPAVVLLDLAMPVMDGFEALAAIREQAPDTRVVVLSGFAQAHVGQRALDLGADAYVEKGTPFDQLCDRVDRLLRRGAGAGA